MSLIQFVTDLRSTSLSNTQKHQSFVNFSTYFNGLKSSALGVRSFSDKQLSEHIFKRTWKEKEEKVIVEKHLYAAGETLSRLSAIINVTNFSDFEFTLSMLAYDMYELVRYVEEEILKNTLRFNMASRPGQTGREIFDVARQIFSFGTLNPSKLYLREFIPVSVFLLRQTIEVHGKRFLGVNSVLNKQGLRANGVSTQVAWEFMKKESLKASSRITHRVNIDIILVIEKWTNYYVHTGEIPSIFLIENAIHMVQPLFYPGNTSVKNYRNHFVGLGTGTIKEYRSVKEDFEDFVNQNQVKNQFWKWLSDFKGLFKKQKGKPMNKVNWADINSLDSTLISL